MDLNKSENYDALLILVTVNEIINNPQKSKELKEIFEFMRKSAKENKEAAKEFLLYALEDIKSAKILYKEKIFSNSVYHLQQAIEKMVKSCALGSGIIPSLEDAKREIGHFVPDTLLKGKLLK